MRSRDIRTSLYSKILPLQALIPFALAISPDRGTLAWGNGGEGGIRTPGPLRVNGFQDRRLKPLGHLSGLRVQEYPMYLPGHMDEDQVAEMRSNPGRYDLRAAGMRMDPSASW